MSRLRLDSFLTVAQAERMRRAFDRADAEQDRRRRVDADAAELLLGGCVSVLFNDGLRVRARVRDGCRTVKVSYSGSWRCESDRERCAHVEAVSRVVKVL